MYLTKLFSFVSCVEYFNPIVASTNIDVEHQFPVLSDGTPPLFRQAPHVVDQRGKSSLLAAIPCSSMLSLKLAALKRSSAST
jgi:hypothetical protein